MQLKSYLILTCLLTVSHQLSRISLINTKVWGPGLEPHSITLPARYFFIEANDDDNKPLIQDLSTIITINYEGMTIKSQKQCRVWSNILDRKDGSVIVRYKVYEPCQNFKISVKAQNKHIGASPYLINETVYSDDCNCPNYGIGEFLDQWKCGDVPQQIKKDLNSFPEIHWSNIRENVIKAFDKPHSISLCHYLIKNNEIYRKCYGKYVGFKMFTDSILLSLTRKVNLPDLEFFVNLGDWPLVSNDLTEKFPIFSWCGSKDSYDIVMPTYDLTESTLEMMGRVMLDIFSVQGNVKNTWEERVGKAFWRGRDSNRQRLDLVDISREYPDLFNVSLTNFFFFRDQEDKYGPKSDYVSFFEFFNYKYQLAIDGTVAAYRFPYLLAGGSLIFKQTSKYYEHFYNELLPDIHYIPIKHDLSDLVEKLKWAKENDVKAQEIAKTGQNFANANLLPQHLFCYYVHLLNEFHKKLVSKVEILKDMEKVEQNFKINCDCVKTIKDEL